MNYARMLMLLMNRRDVFACTRSMKCLLFGYGFSNTHSLFFWQTYRLHLSPLAMAKYGKCDGIQSAFLMRESNFEAKFDACAVELHTIGKQWKRRHGKGERERESQNSKSVGI